MAKSVPWSRLKPRKKYWLAFPPPACWVMMTPGTVSRISPLAQNRAIGKLRRAGRALRGRRRNPDHAILAALHDHFRKLRRVRVCGFWSRRCHWSVVGLLSNGGASNQTSQNHGDQPCRDEAKPVQQQGCQNETKSERDHAGRPGHFRPVGETMKKREKSNKQHSRTNPKVNSPGHQHAEHSHR